ncbi:MAG: transglutaminase family protein [Rhodospirillum sp.]|nr:transglutaminase family protein [Rhodospirillum sp.]MCF8489209.1 transglutaminase family protein [Rhodospirillum sp.]MCF8500000.1 transglutaminase family protein [Rhodospirillum sp.]
MTTLRIRHATTYRYEQPVSFHPHRLMLRPRESHEVRLLEMTVTVDPPARIRWTPDVSGNIIGTATFGAISDRLFIESDVMLELTAAAWPVFDIAASAISYPFRYDNESWTDLGALTRPGYDDPTDRLRDWARGFVLGETTDTLSLLKDVNAGVSSALVYQSRDEEGTQSPLTSLERRRGSCRDFAVLFVEAVRHLGLGARIVSGYSHDPDNTRLGTQGGGSTHAWAEVHVPGAGWIVFDPTNNAMGGANLIPVAVGRYIHQLVPVSGSFTGSGDTPLDMEVRVFMEET